eukprot:344067-Hanusia_phi.AAC.1
MGSGIQLDQRTSRRSSERMGGAGLCEGQGMLSGRGCCRRPRQRAGEGKKETEGIEEWGRAQEW